MTFGTLRGRIPDFSVPASSDHLYPMRLGTEFSVATDFCDSAIALYLKESSISHVSIRLVIPMIGCVNTH